MELPEKGLVRAYSGGGQASGNAAALPWGAVGGVGEQLQSLGERGAALLSQHQEMAVRRRAAEMELDFDELHSGYESQMLQNPSLTPQEAMDGWDKLATGFESRYLREGMSPLEQDVIGLRARQLVQRGKLGVMESSLLANSQNAKQTAINLIRRGELTGNDELRQMGFSNLQGVMPEADIDAARIESDYKVRQQERKRSIAADPGEYLQANPSDKVPEGQDPYEYRADRSYALSLQGQQQQESQDLGREAILGGEIESESQIDQFVRARGALPSVREHLRQALAEKTDMAIQLERSSEGYINRTAGEVSSVLNTFNPENVEERLALDAKISTLPAGAVKNYYREELKKAIEGRPEPDTPLSENLKLADGAFKKNFFGRATLQPMRTERAINDGFLGDRGKLLALGFSEEQATNIIDGTEAEREKKGFVQNDSGRRSEFKNLWSQRKGEIKADKLTQATADAILSGAETINDVAPGEYNKALDTYGRVKTQTINWAKQNPDASVDEIRAYMLKIAAPDSADAFIDAAFDSTGLDGMVLPPLESDEELQIILPPLNN